MGGLELEKKEHIKDILVLEKALSSYKELWSRGAFRDSSEFLKTAECDF